MLHLIDRLAGWWFDRRNEQLVASHPEWEDFGIRKFDSGAGGWEATLSTPIAAVLADGLAKFLQENNAENYVQLDLLPRPDRGLPPVRVTVQWARGISPAQKVTQLEKRVEELEQDKSRLEDTFDEYREALTGEKRYVLQPGIGTYCPRCKQPASILCPENMDFTDPAFFICFGCQFIGQVGVGPVERQFFGGDGTSNPGERQ